MRAFYPCCRYHNFLTAAEADHLVQLVGGSSTVLLCHAVLACCTSLLLWDSVNCTACRAQSIHQLLLTYAPAPLLCSLSDVCFVWVHLCRPNHTWPSHRCAWGQLRAVPAAVQQSRSWAVPAVQLTALTLGMDCLDSIGQQSKLPAVCLQHGSCGSWCTTLAYHSQHCCS